MKNCARSILRDSFCEVNVRPILCGFTVLERPYDQKSQLTNTSREIIAIVDDHYAWPDHRKLDSGGYGVRWVSGRRSLNVGACSSLPPVFWHCRGGFPSRNRNIFDRQKCAGQWTDERSWLAHGFARLAGLGLWFGGPAPENALYDWRDYCHRTGGLSDILGDHCHSPRPVT